MKKAQKRQEWLNLHRDTIMALPGPDHSRCPHTSRCRYGNTCFDQSDGGWRSWANALSAVNIPCDPTPFWSGWTSPLSISVRKVIAMYIRVHAPKKIL